MGEFNDTIKILREYQRCLEELPGWDSAIPNPAKKISKRLKGMAAASKQARADLALVSLAQPFPSSVSLPVGDLHERINTELKLPKWLPRLRFDPRLPKRAAIPLK